jgi:hypothetical protein
MLIEIFILFALCRALGNRLREKERNPLGYQFLLVALWFTGEFTGAVVGTVIGMLASGDDEMVFFFFGYGGGLLGGALGAGAVFLIAHLLPSLVIEPMRIDPDDAYGPGWRRSDRELLDRFEQDGNRQRGGRKRSRRQLDDRVQDQDEPNDGSIYRLEQ